MNNQGETYLVLELGTGLVDGWYFDKAMAEEIRGYWDEDRNDYAHVVLESVSNPVPLPEEMRLQSGPPLIECLVQGDSYVFFCDFCQRNHTHSAEPGHRVAHCHNKRSPYHATGYILKHHDCP